MGYKLRKAPKRELYWVVNKETGKKHSKDPIPLERAKAQMRALYSAMRMEGGMEVDTSAPVDHSTRLTTAQLEALRRRVENIDTEADHKIQYREIKGILEDLKEEDFKPHDWREIEILLANIDPLIAGKRGSKPHEFISILEKVLGRVRGGGRPDEQIDARAFQLALMRKRGKTEAYILSVLSEMEDEEGNKLDKGMRDAIFKKYKHYMEHPEEMELTGQGYWKDEFDRRLDEIDRVYLERFDLPRDAGGVRFQTDKLRIRQKLFEDLRRLPKGSERKEIYVENAVRQYNDLKSALHFALHEHRSVPAGSEDQITGDEIQDDDFMYDFNREYAHGRYYKADTARQLEPPINPFTREPIPEFIPYIARLGPRLEGQGAIPDRSLLWKIAKASYSPTPPERIDSLTLVHSTPTLKFYKEGNDTIVVGIRGTKPTEVGDLKADALLAVNSLSYSERYKKDLATIQEFQKKYPTSEYDYYGVGHSLGGAVLDNFLRQGLIDKGVSYNPAVQPLDWKAHLPNNRIYMSDDPLYLIMGQHTEPKPEVRNRKKGILEGIVSGVPYLGKMYGSLQAHKLDNFRGGGLSKQLSEAGLNPDSYLELARKKAKNHGYDPKRLNLSDKGKSHKLMYMTEDGKKVHFGRVGYGDFIIWSGLERSGKVPKGTADKKRRTFQASHSKIKGDWRSNPHSANNLALSILW